MRPMHAACLNGKCDAATLLLDRGAEVDCLQNDGAAPLHGTCFKGYIDATRLLLDRGATIDRENHRGATALHATCLAGHADVARLLLERGADYNRSFGDFLPQNLARLHGHAALADWLARVRAVGWAQHLSESRYKLVVLRGLAARGDARRERAFYGKEKLLDLLFPGGRANARATRGQPRLPDELFAIVARYYWGGGMSVEEEIADAAEKEERAAQIRAESYYDYNEEPDEDGFDY